MDDYRDDLEEENLEGRELDPLLDPLDPLADPLEADELFPALDDEGNPIDKDEESEDKLLDAFGFTPLDDSELTGF